LSNVILPVLVPSCKIVILKLSNPFVHKILITLCKPVELVCTLKVLVVTPLKVVTPSILANIPSPSSTKDKTVSPLL